MIKRKFYSFVLILVALSGMIGAQSARLTDDRELFMGVTGTNKIKPNLLILFDNSGSMESAIYHPAYNPKTNYNPTNNSLESTFTNLNSIFLDFNDDDNTGNRFSNTAAHTLTDVATFKVCRGQAVYTYAYNARFTFLARKGNTTPRVWYISKSGVLPVGTVPQVGNVLSFSCSNPGGATQPVCTNTTISKVANGTYNGNPVWEVTVNASTNPAANSAVYINYHKEVSWNTAVALMKQSEDSSSYHETILLKLYGADLSRVPSVATQYSTQDDGVMYDDNYLFWLFYNATTEQLNQVSAWATGADQGKFPDEFGVLQNAGFHRIGVARQTLQDLTDTVYEDVYLGLASFGSTSSAGGVINSPINPATFNLTTFKNSIGAIKTNAQGTMLAETMADVWKYFKGGGTYVPNTGLSGSGTIDASPFIPYCRRSYVILMTDGQSTSDNFDDAKYNNSIFRQNVSTWGDSDTTYDPPGTGTGRNQPNGSATYCPQNTCWIPSSSGTDFLDDVAFLMNDRDMFPESIAAYSTMIGKQNVQTYVIGLTVDNDMLKAAAVNGDGQYYTANNAQQLKDSLESIITNINLRDFAFAAFTAPKRVTNNIGEGASYVGYFLPSGALSAEDPFWEGHLQSFLMTDKWCPELSDPADETPECSVASYESEYACENDASNNPGGKPCTRTLTMNSVATWDARKILEDSTGARSLFTHNSAAANPNLMIAFTTANASNLQPLFPSGPTLAQTQAIATTLNQKKLGDIFHSDIAYVGPPAPAKIFLKNLNPAECGVTTGTPKTEDANCFENFLATYGPNASTPRKKVIYFGTNDGILHQVDAATGAELWGFIPDEALPTIQSIVEDREYAFTVDGRLSAEDIYFRDAVSGNSWKTILPFGMRDGGNAFYTLDVTQVNNQPKLLWKFKDDTYSGKSWGKPIIGKIQYNDGTEVIERWVVVFAGGFAFNNEDPDELQGKAVFVVDASDGSLIWMIGYKPTGVTNPGASDDSGTIEIDVVKDDSVTTGLRYLTAKNEFNYSIPAALTVIDRDNNGFFDTIYFGNVGGHLFKTDISSTTPAAWKTYLLFDNEITSILANNITAKSGGVVTVANAAGFAEGQTVIGSISHAMGVVSLVNGNALTISPTPAVGGPSFIVDENLLIKNFDPIFLQPVVAFDTCYNLWVAFGTGDRTRTRTNPTTGKFVALRDGTTLVSTLVQKTGIGVADLVEMSWDDDTLEETSIRVADKWGFYFTFPDVALYEKLFDPDPLILPDLKLRPHFYFNTYQRPSGTSSGSDECNAPEDATMKFYDIILDYCGTGNVAGTSESGRLAGGGMFIDYLIIQGSGELGSVPPAQKIMDFKLTYTGGLLFWKEKKR